MSQGKAYRKLTAELVRRALLSVQLSGINSAVAKDPNAITFPTEIHRDGPGHLAVVDLPYGVEAADVIARRGRLASGLRLPLDQVWPEPAPGHTGRLALWVGHEPASQMRQPAWPLLRSGTVDLFKPFPFATTPRLDTVMAELMFRNWLFGGQPGSGKSFALRLLVLAAALDIRPEIRGYELKGIGDFAPVAPVCAEYGSGNDDDTLTACADMFGWLYGEGQKRAKRIRALRRAGQGPGEQGHPRAGRPARVGAAPDGGVRGRDPGAVHLRQDRQGSRGDRGEVHQAVPRARHHPAAGHPDPRQGQPADRDHPQHQHPVLPVRRGPGRQRHDPRHLARTSWATGPPSSSRAPRPGGASWPGWASPAPAARSTSTTTRPPGSWPARSRPAPPPGSCPNRRTTPARPAADVLADVAAIWPAGEDAAWNETLLERLAQLRPEVYGRWEPAQLTTALSGYGITTGQIGRRIDGKTVNRRGPARADILTAVTERNRNRGGG